MAESNREKISTIYKHYDTVADRDFLDLQERFNTEIRKVEERMAELRSKLMDKDGNFLQTMNAHENVEQGRSKHHDITSISPPVIQKDGNRNVMKLKFDVSHFAPEEVVVSAVDEKLSVHAKHEQRLGNKNIYRESNREFRLPSGINPRSIRSKVTRDGVLTVDAPLPRLPMPSKFQTSLKKS